MARPPKYRKEFCEMLVEHMSKGLSYSSFAGLIGVTREALYKWEKRHEQFLHSKKLGHTKMELFFEKMGISAMAGKLPGFNAATYIFTLKNKLRWSDRIETENTNHNISITFEEESS